MTRRGAQSVASSSTSGAEKRGKGQLIDSGKGILDSPTELALDDDTGLPTISTAAELAHRTAGEQTAFTPSQTVE